MMKIVLFGYGKMGQLIEQFAQQRGHEIHLIVDESNRDRIGSTDLETADIAIDFSIPTGVLDNINLCLDARIPLVIGTTGWYEQLNEVRTRCKEMNGSLLYGSNFSIGVNVLFHLNKVLANVMAPYKSYDIQVEEIHHTHKLDAPSGTAITLAEGILEQNPAKQRWINHLMDETEEQVAKQDELLIESHRLEEVPGTHTVIYSSDIDQIELKHVAHNRKGFAYGAILASEWLKGKKGFFEVREMFDFS